MQINMHVAEIRGAADLARFILGRYSGKVVEVGAGGATEVAARLNKHLEILATDKINLDNGRIKVIADDIFSPQKEIYEGACLLYSIRPPLEMQLAMGRLASDLASEVIVRPLGDEVAQLSGFDRTLINFGQARFYLFTRRTL